MKGLKIQDLQEGKIYRFYRGDGAVLSGVYMVNEQGELYCRHKYCKNKNDFSKSTLSYNTIINGYFDEIEREIDWSKVPRGTKVQVKKKEEGLWCNRYFVEFRLKIDGFFPFVAGLHLDDSFTSYKMDVNASDWQYCRIHPSVEIPDEWYKEVE